MKILIPTAKEMKIDSSNQKLETLPEKSKMILDVLLKYDIKDLARIYKIKEEQAQKESLRLKNIASLDAKIYEAINLFDGLMYRNIKRVALTEKEKDYVGANVFIASSFYGIISAYEKISEHRLDFLQNIKVGSMSLKQYWRSEYDEFLKNEDFAISLLSKEFEEVFSKDLRSKLIKIIFMEKKDGELKVHSTISKKARGKFLSQLIEKNIDSIEEIKNIEFDNYGYKEDLSSEKELIFVRN
ncbi:peroxide stress protein YaaA [Gemella sp. zg-570]|uniref:peroxide stress protein YaaA n=1 Tax=Gemella sp. zg-570 TaxID=2840371 RepID=UPI001C0D02F0|nr:peroxide stress protein YaaA [Gemella sp. zg-570]QWQ38306.1 peroxide stress protein YaaA [Gemella sp. zg-570]